MNLSNEEVQCFCGAAVVNGRLSARHLQNVCGRRLDASRFLLLPNFEGQKVRLDVRELVVPQNTSTCHVVNPTACGLSDQRLGRSDSSDGCELLEATHGVWKMIQKRIASPRKFQGTFVSNEICNNCSLRMSLWSVLRLRCCRNESKCSVGGGVSMACVEQGERKKIGRQGGSSRGSDKDTSWT